MSKAVVISIRKEHNDKIFAGIKKWEGRKTCPVNVKVKNYIDPTATYNKSDDDVTFYVYEPKSGGGCGKVVGEFICDFAQSFHKNADYAEIVKALCVSAEFARSYFNKGKGYMIRVNEPKRYDQPKDIEDFNRPCDGDCDCCKYSILKEDRIDCCKMIERPPQSWCYVEEI